MSLLSDADRRRLDDRPDTTFYEEPRLVTHAGDAFLDRLTELYAAVLSPGDRVFDAMSSWVSHLPEMEFEHVHGHGLNETELALNDRLDDHDVQNLNVEQRLPLPDDDRDAVLCALSVQYLQYPAATFAEFERVLAPEGVLVVSFTDRMFPAKAIRAWREATMDERLALVEAYVESTDSLTVERTVTERPGLDPFSAVVARRP